MDITSITAAYTSLKSLKEIASYVLKTKVDSEVQQRLNELLHEIGNIQDILFYTREELHRLQNENQDLKDRVRELREELSLKAKVRWKKPSYWVEEDNHVDGPFCQKCYDADSKLIRLQDKGSDRWYCNNCNSCYEGPQYREPRDKSGSYDPRNWR